jgi:two-component system response regulator AtoC
VATIKVPPLRERAADIPLLVEYLLEKINREINKDVRRIEQSALKRMMSYEWPGNVRELENVLTHAAINTQGDTIFEEMIMPLLGKSSNNHVNPSEADDMEQSLKDIEKDHIIAVLNRTHWHLGQACELLGITRPTLRHKLKMYNKDIETP